MAAQAAEVDREQRQRGQQPDDLRGSQAPDESGNGTSFARALLHRI